MTRALRTLLPFLVSMLVVAAPARPQDVSAVTVATDGRTLTFTPRASYDHLSLRVAAPDGRVFDTHGSGGAVTFQPFAISGDAPPEGSYTWEIRLTPRGAIRPELMARARRERESGNAETEGALRMALGRAVRIESGGFRILDGKLIAGQDTEPGATRRRPPLEASRALISPASFASTRPFDHFNVIDQVIPDDLIVQSSLWCRL